MQDCIVQAILVPGDSGLSHGWCTLLLLRVIHGKRFAGLATQGDLYKSTWLTWNYVSQNSLLSSFCHPLPSFPVSPSKPHNYPSVERGPDSVLHWEG